MTLRNSRLFLAGLSLVASISAVGCGNDEPEPADSAAIPVIDVALNRGYAPNKGLVTPLDNTGNPVRDGATMDPVVIEARKFYDTLQAPGAVEEDIDYPDPFGGTATRKKTAPQTFDAWKKAFNIPARNPGESLPEYRIRTKAVVYYNKNELGLGRELGCAEFPDGVDGNNQPLTGVACYVTNYGTMFRDTYNSLAIAEEGSHPKNTVCISYRPSLGAGYEVQFYTYNGDGLRREAAALDTLGPRPLPHVCVNCHGGVYDEAKHLAKNARFLPLDPNVVLFAATGPVSRAAQEEAIRFNNFLSTKTPLTDMQTDMLNKLYKGGVATAGTKSENSWYPDAWGATAENREAFDKLFKPNCTTCHAAMSVNGSGPIPVYQAFKSPQGIVDSGPAAFVCNQFTMPNSQATLLNFWSPSKEGKITFDGKDYKTDADAMLDWLGMTREDCFNLEKVTKCNRLPGDEGEKLCGNAFSGKGCNQVTGACEPAMGWLAPTARTAPNGICRTNGTRGCPFPENCVKSMTPAVKGLETYDGVCMQPN